jgi:hypothetical protein
MGRKRLHRYEMPVPLELPGWLSERGLGRFGLGRFDNFEYGFQLGDSQEVTHRLGRIQQGEINPGCLESHERAHASCVNSVNLPQIEDETAFLAADGCAQQSGFFAVHETAGAMQNRGMSRIFNSYFQHDLLS